MNGIRTCVKEAPERSLTPSIDAAPLWAWSRLPPGTGSAHVLILDFQPPEL